MFQPDHGAGALGRVFPAAVVFAVGLEHGQLVFLANLPLAVLALVLIARYVPATQAESKKSFDLFGFVFLSICIGAFARALCV